MDELLRDGECRNRIVLDHYLGEGVGRPTLEDILAELEKPGRDPRPEFKTATFQEGVETLADLQPGMQLEEEDRVITKKARVELVFDDGERMGYDILVIATGAHVRPEETAGMLGEHWQRDVFDFYTLDGATALRDKLATFEIPRRIELERRMASLASRSPSATASFILFNLCAQIVSSLF